MINKVMPIFGRRLSPSADTPLLDTYGGASVAYSLRYLSTAFTGNAVVRVRRSNDNAELDFTPTEITDGTLITWTGANDGFVNTLYDQSGNGVNAIQTVAGSQPQIVSAGTVLTSSGKPSIRFVNKALIHNLTITGLSSLHALFAIGQVISPTPYGDWFLSGANSDSTNGMSLLSQASTTPSNWGTFQGRPRPSNSNINDSLPHLCTMIRNTSITANGSFYLDSSSDGIYIATSGGLAMSIGRVGNCNDYISEIVLYNSDQSANRTGIESNINSYYSIY